jgi:hypothetical protein
MSLGRFFENRRQKYIISFQSFLKFGQLWNYVKGIIGEIWRNWGADTTLLSNKLK